MRVCVVSSHILLSCWNPTADDLYLDYYLSHPFRFTETYGMISIHILPHEHLCHMYGMFVRGCVLMPAYVCFLCISVHEGLASASFIQLCVFQSLSYCVLRARPKLTQSFKSKPLWTETNLGWKYRSLQVLKVADLGVQRRVLYNLPGENSAHRI